MRVVTKMGYSLDLEESVDVGEFIRVPPPTPETYSEVDDNVVRFLARRYGMQKEWSRYLMEKYDAPGLERLPQYLLDMPDKQLHMFLVHLISSGAALVKHQSGTGAPSQPEMRIKFIHEGMAKDVQYLFLRVGVKAKVIWHGQLGRWLVQTSGMGGYVEIRKYVMESKNPKLMKKMRELDFLVPFRFKFSDDTSVRDKVVEVVDG